MKSIKIGAQQLSKCELFSFPTDFNFIEMKLKSVNHFLFRKSKHKFMPKKQKTKTKTVSLAIYTNYQIKLTQHIENIIEHSQEQ